MKKTAFLILIFCVQNSVLAQKKLNESDWIKILSGKIETYQAYNIKTVKLSNNGKIIKQIDYNPATNKLTAYGEKDTVTYVFDRENRLANAYFSQSWYTFAYPENGKKANYFQLNINEDSLQQSRIISYPYPENPKIEWFEFVSKSRKNGEIISSSSEKYIINPKDSLLSYFETMTNKNFYRQYDNGATSQLKYNSEKNYSYDSIYVRPNGIRFAKNEIAEDDKLYRHISVGDSLYTSIFKAGILNEQRIMFQSILRQESKYNPQSGELLQSETYTYFPENKYGGLIHWKTEHQDFETQKTETIYPNKKKYKLRDNVLIERKKLNLRLNLFRKRKVFECGTIRGCGSHAYEIRKIRPYYLYNIASTSVLADHYYLVQNFDSYVFEDSFVYDDYQSLIQAELFEDIKKSTFSDICKTGRIPQDVQNELIKITKKWYRRKDKYKDYKVEITTYDNKKFECKPIDYLDQIHLPIDVFSYRGDF